MKISTHRFRLTSRSKVMAAAAMLLAVASAVGVTAGTANAAKPRPTRTPAPLPTAIVPAPTPPIPTSVPVPSSFQVTSNVPDNFQVQISPATQLGDAELLSGPTVGGPVIITVGDGGRVAFLRLVENSDYVFRYRNKIWIPSTSSFIYSEWVQFSFHTPTFDSLRPAAPQNLRVVERTATTITVRWDPVPTAVRYDFSLNGGAPVQTGVCSGAYCTPTDPLTATFPRPAAGTSVLFSVTATRNEPGCGAYCFPDLRFVTSFPATLVVTN
jgi:hypothetical protein